MEMGESQWILRDNLTLWGVKNYLQIFDSSGIGTPNACVVQGSTVFTKDVERIMGNQQGIEGDVSSLGLKGIKGGSSYWMQNDMQARGGKKPHL